MLSKIPDLEKELGSHLLHRTDKRPSNELLAAELKWSRAVWEAAQRLGLVPLEKAQIKAGVKLCKHPIFICGVHRSGTTLVRDLLDCHPELTVLPAEGSYFTNLATKIEKMPIGERKAFMATEWIRRLANPINQPPYWLLGQSSSVESPYVMFARQFITWWELDDERWNKLSFRPLLTTMLSYASMNGLITANQWVDKTPANEQFITKIWKGLPGSRMIHIIRNPVDIFISRKRMEPTLNIRTFLRVLQKSFRVAYKQSRENNDRYLLIRYEELCESPAIVIKRIAEFLKIGFTPGLLIPTVNGKPSSANSSFKQASKAGQILAADEHGHNEQLSQGDYQLLSAHIGRSARRLGYSIRPVNFLRSLSLKLKYSL